MRLLFYILPLILGFLLVSLGVTIWFILPVIVKHKVNDLLPLSKKTVIYDEWSNTSMPIYMEFWYFNITNMNEIENGGKPNLNQTGPYTYREYRIKENIIFFDNGTVSYRQKRIFFFDRSKSVGSEDDIITTINIPVLVIADKINNFPILKPFVKYIIAQLENGTVLMNVSVKNITWGYVDPILEMVAELAKFLNITVDPTVGLFYKKNNTDDGAYLVDSGYLGLKNFLGIHKWEYSTKLSFWNSTITNMINGTDGTMFPPFLGEWPDDQPLYVFQSDICRSIYATYSSQSIVNGIPARTYTPPYSVFANETVNPDNEGFCVDNVCLGSGVLNLSPCIKGMPVVMSQPHLYQAADKYQEQIVGLHPSTDCITSLSIEPTTGLPLNLQKKMQINIAVSAVSNIAHMSKLRSMLLPVMWLNESVVIDEKNANLIKTMLLIPVRAGKGSSIGLMSLGLVLMVAILITAIVKSRYISRNTIINDPNYQRI